MKSVLTLITKLSDRTINGELLKYLAKTANDEQPGIRTNTTICLGKIAKHLGSSSRAKVLIAAFSRSLRDPFVHARNAALMALAVTGDYFSEEDCAFRILPAVCPSLIDKEKLIRDQASKTVDIYLQKIRKAAASMPDTALPPETATAGGGGPRMSTPQPAESATASWAGWAISSFTNKLSAAAGEIQASAASPTTTPANGPSRAAAKRPSIFSNATFSKANSPQRQAVKSPPTSAPLPSSSNKESSSFFPDDDDDADDGGDAWGDMDVMDDGDGDGNNNGNQPEDFFTADEDSKPPSTTLPKRTATPTLTASTATPFDDGSEPDFAGWLAAQAERKKKTLGGAGGLPKGLAKAGSAGPASATAKKTPTGASASKAKTGAAAAKKKKIDMKPKETDDDDGWGGW